MNTAKDKIIIIQSRIVKSLAATSVVLMVVYLYCVNITAFTAASCEQLATVIDEANSSISNYESTLNEINRNITKEMASEYQLININESEFTFAMRNVPAKLTINE